MTRLMVWCVPDEALRWGRLTGWWGEWRSGLSRPPPGHRSDLLIWDDLGPDDRCDWTGCNERAVWVTPSVSVVDGLTEYLADTRWCDEHHKLMPPFTVI